MVDFAFKILLTKILFVRLISFCPFIRFMYDENFLAGITDFCSSRYTSCNCLIRPCFVCAGIHNGTFWHFFFVSSTFTTNEQSSNKDASDEELFNGKSSYTKSSDELSKCIGEFTSHWRLSNSSCHESFANGLTYVFWLVDNRGPFLTIIAGVKEISLTAICNVWKLKI